MTIADAPPGRLQANGRAERGVATIKQGVAANVLFLEGKLGIRVALEAPLIAYAIKHTARMSYLYGRSPDSSAAPVDRARGRRSSPKQNTCFFFGCLLLAKPSERDHHEHPLENLAEVVYLGPWSTSGGGIVALPCGETEMKRFQAAKVISFSDIEALLQPRASRIPVERRPAELPLYEPMVPNEPQGSIQVPPGGPPVKWVRQNGGTPGTACKQICETGSFHGKPEGARPGTGNGCSTRPTRKVVLRQEFLWVAHWLG